MTRDTGTRSRCTCGITRKPTSRIASARTVNERCTRRTPIPTCTTRKRATGMPSRRPVTSYDRWSRQPCADRKRSRLCKPACSRPGEAESEPVLTAVKQADVAALAIAHAWAIEHLPASVDQLTCAVTEWGVETSAHRQGKSALKKAMDVQPSAGGSPHRLDPDTEA